MDKKNIILNNLCISGIISVIKNNNRHHHKLLTVNGRHSDAFVYVIEGSCSYRFEKGTEFTVNTGDVFYLPHGSVYTMFIHTEDYKFIFCDFEFNDPEPRGAVLFSNRSLKNIDTLFWKLLNRYRSHAGNRYTESMSILYGIYSQLKENSDRSYLDKNKKDDMARVKSYIDEAFGKSELSVSELAETIGVSEVYLRKLFKAGYGISPIKYLTSVRLKNAMKLMKYPFLTLEECATESGFSSLQYFCRIFKKEIGISPGKYRNEL